MKQSQFRQIIKEEVRKVLNESFTLEDNEKLLKKMTINDPTSGDWDMRIVGLNDSYDDEEEGEEYILICGEHAKSTTDGGRCVWIPKTQWDEFKRLIYSI